jgi:hypothetical protein
MFLQILTAPDDLHTILSVKAVLCAAIRANRSRCAIGTLKLMPGGLAVVTIAHRTYDGHTNNLNGSLAAWAPGETTLLIFSHF